MILAAALCALTPLADPPARDYSQLRLGFSHIDSSQGRDVSLSGAYGELDYGWSGGDYGEGLPDWLGASFYIAALIDGGRCSDKSLPCNSLSVFAMPGMKLRIRAPFEVVRPFIEAGGGLSLNVLTNTRATDGTQSHLINHLVGAVVAAAGVEFGRDPAISVAGNAFVHPDTGLIAWAITIGFTGYQHVNH